MLAVVFLLCPAALMAACGGKATEIREPRQVEVPKPEPKTVTFDNTPVAKPRDPFVLTLGELPDGSPIPAEYAFCAPARGGRAKSGDNQNPALSWTEGPEGTMSYALLVVDPDAPADGKDVNKKRRKIAADAERTEFYHWVVVDIQPNTRSIDAGADSDAVTARGKEQAFRPYGKIGLNDYTNWFANDRKMSGDYFGYDGPCPPWNDERVHNYRFELYALRVPSLALEGAFNGSDVVAAMEGQVIEKVTWTGTYTLNAKLR